MSKRSYALLALLFLFVSGCKSAPKEVKREDVRILQAEPQERYTVVGEASGYGGTGQLASERLQHHSYRLGAEAVVLRTTETLPGIDGPIIKVTGTAIRYSAE